MRHTMIVPLVVLAACWQGKTRATEPPTAAAQTRAPADLAATKYDAAFDVVFQTTLDATRAKYPTLEQDATARTIKTAWHLVDRIGDTRYFARLDIELEGPPWSIAITPKVSEWRVGEAAPLETDAGPVRLAGTVAALRAGVHEKLGKYQAP